MKEEHGRRYPRQWRDPQEGRLQDELVSLYRVLRNLIEVTAPSLPEVAHDAWFLRRGEAIFLVTKTQFRLGEPRTCTLGRPIPNALGILSVDTIWRFAWTVRGMAIVDFEGEPMPAEECRIWIAAFEEFRGECQRQQQALIDAIT